MRLIHHHHHHDHHHHVPSSARRSVRWQLRNQVRPGKKHTPCPERALCVPWSSASWARGSGQAGWKRGSARGTPCGPKGASLLCLLATNGHRPTSRAPPLSCLLVRIDVAAREGHLCRVWLLLREQLSLEAADARVLLLPLALERRDRLPPAETASSRGHRSPDPKRRRRGPRHGCGDDAPRRDAPRGRAMRERREKGGGDGGERRTSLAMCWTCSSARESCAFCRVTFFNSAWVDEAAGAVLHVAAAPPCASPCAPACSAATAEPTGGRGAPSPPPATPPG